MVMSIYVICWQPFSILNVAQSSFKVSVAAQARGQRLHSFVPFSIRYRSVK